MNTIDNLLSDLVGQLELVPIDWSVEVSAFVLIK